MATTLKYKIGVLGYLNTGKTTFVKTLEDETIPPIDDDLIKHYYSLSYSTDKYKFIFSLIDYDSAYKVEYLNDLDKLDGIIVLYDMTNTETVFEALTTIHIVCSKSKEIPIILIGNKADMISTHIDRQDTYITKSLQAMGINVTSVFNVSCKYERNLVEPFLKFASYFTQEEITHFN